MLWIVMYLMLLTQFGSRAIYHIFSSEAGSICLCVVKCGVFHLCQLMFVLRQQPNEQVKFELKGGHVYVYKCDVILCTVQGPRER